MSADDETVFSVNQVCRSESRNASILSSANLRPGMPKHSCDSFGCRCCLAPCSNLKVEPALRLWVSILLNVGSAKSRALMPSAMLLKSRDVKRALTTSRRASRRDGQQVTSDNRNKTMRSSTSTSAGGETKDKQFSDRRTGNHSRPWFSAEDAGVIALRTGVAKVVASRLERRTGQICDQKRLRPKKRQKKKICENLSFFGEIAERPDCKLQLGAHRVKTILHLRRD